MRGFLLEKHHVTDYCSSLVWLVMTSCPMAGTWPTIHLQRALHILTHRCPPSSINTPMLRISQSIVSLGKNIVKLVPVTENNCMLIHWRDSTEWADSGNFCQLCIMYTFQVSKFDFLCFIKCSRKTEPGLALSKRTKNPPGIIKLIIKLWCLF